jgi:hypothetical protein
MSIVVPHLLLGVVASSLAPEHRGSFFRFAEMCLPRFNKEFLPFSDTRRPDAFASEVSHSNLSFGVLASSVSQPGSRGYFRSCQGVPRSSSVVRFFARTTWFLEVGRPPLRLTHMLDLKRRAFEETNMTKQESHVISSHELQSHTHSVPSGYAFISTFPLSGLTTGTLS